MDGRNVGRSSERFRPKPDGMRPSNWGHINGQKMGRWWFHFPPGGQAYEGDSDSRETCCAWPPRFPGDTL